MNSVVGENMRQFEKVHTMTTFFDGPKGGVADFDGRPHIYEAVFDDAQDAYTDVFMLMPIDDEVFRLSLEDWAIWCRWEDAFQLGLAGRDTYPTLPDDRPRHEELTQLIGERLSLQRKLSFAARAEFRSGKESTTRRKGIHDVEVRWTVLS